MTKARIKKGQWVRVTWADAASYHNTDWKSPAEADAKSGITTCVTAGYVIASTRSEIKLAQNLSTEDGDVAHIMAIPRGWITKVEVWK